MIGTSLQSKGAPVDVSHKADVAPTLIRGGRASALNEKKKKIQNAMHWTIIVLALLGQGYTVQLCQCLFCVLCFYGYTNTHQSQNAKRASGQKRHMVISIFLPCNSLILMSIGAGSIRAIKGGLDKVFKIRDRLHRICRLIFILAQSCKFSFLAYRGSIRAI